MVNSPQQRGGKNKCRGNAKYACNYGNIKAGKCPGYLVSSRNVKRTADSERSRQQNNIRALSKDMKDPKYYLKWHGRNSDNAQDFWYTGNANLVEANGATLQQWNNQRCKPRNQKGKISPAARDKDPNYLCKIYALRDRQQQGCVATTKDNGRVVVGEYRKGRHAGTLYSPVRQQQQQQQQLTPEQKRYNEMEKAGWVLNYGLFEKRADFKVRDTHKGVSVFAARNLHKDTRLPYLGKIITKQEWENLKERDNDKYIVTARNKGKNIIINGSPKVIQQKINISIASYVNEPSNDEKYNALLQDDAKYIAAIVLTRDVKKGEEILACYGEGYGERDYETSCGKEDEEELSSLEVVTYNEIARKSKSADDFSEKVEEYYEEEEHNTEVDKQVIDRVLKTKSPVVINAVNNIAKKSKNSEDFLDYMHESSNELLRRMDAFDPFDPKNYPEGWNSPRRSKTPPPKDKEEENP